MFGGFDYARAVMSRQEMTNFCIFGNFGEMYLFFMRAICLVYF